MVYTFFDPLSANGRGFELLDRFKIDYSYDYEEIEYVNILTESFDNASNMIVPTDIIFIIGGDQTVNSVINKYLSLNLSCEVFLYAPEDANDFLVDIDGEPYKLINITKYLKNLPYTIIDQEKIYFLNNVGYGLDGRVCAIAQEKEKTHANYNYKSIAAKLILIYKKKRATVIVDDKEYSYKNIFLLSTFNSRYYGNHMMAAPTQDRLSSSLTIMVMRSKTHIGAISIFKSIIKGEHLKYKDKIEVLTGNHIIVRFETPEYIQVDGKVIGEVYEYEAFKEKETLE